jgi:hypothetical protein
MGLGDWIMATGEARVSQEKDGQRVVFVGADGRVYWSEVFHGNPRISMTQGPGITVLRQGGGLRPYIEAKGGRQWTWRRYGPPVGELYFAKDEEAFGHRFRGRIIIEPNVKAVGHMNKDWGRPKWAELAKRLDGPVAQFVGPRSSPLPGIEQIGTPSFRHAAAVLKYSKAAVLPEGGLHHAAAAVGLPAVVIFGGFISPEVTGYRAHRNLYSPDAAHPLGCGSRINCAHCKAAMGKISVEIAMQALREVLSA